MKLNINRSFPGVSFFRYHIFDSKEAGKIELSVLTVFVFSIFRLWVENEKVDSKFILLKEFVLTNEGSESDMGARVDLEVVERFFKREVFLSVGGRSIQLGSWNMMPTL